MSHVTPGAGVGVTTECAGKRQGHLKKKKEGTAIISALGRDSQPPLLALKHRPAVSHSSGGRSRSLQGQSLRPPCGRSQPVKRDLR